MVSTASSAVVVVETISSGALFLRLALSRFDFFVFALREVTRGVVVVVVETPFWAEFRARRGFTVDQTEGGVFVGGESSGEGIVAGKVENSVVEIVVATVRVVVEVASPIGDSAEFFGAGKGGERDVDGNGGGRGWSGGCCGCGCGGGGGFGWAPAVGVERDETDFETCGHHC